MADKEITLRNTMRRPLSVRIAGQTLRLSPGEQRRVPAAWMASPELQRFTQSGFVSSAPAVAAAPAAEAEPQKADRKKPKSSRD